MYTLWDSPSGTTPVYSLVKRTFLKQMRRNRRREQEIGKVYKQREEIRGSRKKEGVQYRLELLWRRWNWSPLSLRIVQERQKRLWRSETIY